MYEIGSLLVCFVFLSLLSSALSSQACSLRFTPINGSLCINSDFVRNITGVTSVEHCAILCGLRPQCQAYSLSDGPCQLFEFNKCSKSVRDCGCSRRGRVFVRQQPGLPAGRLCPSGYGDDFCGVKYKVVSGSWNDIKSTCESESGLVIMADVMSMEELEHIKHVRSLHGSRNTLWLGGFQAPGSAEPDGGWYWVGCNNNTVNTVSSNLWSDGEPNDDSGGQGLLAAYNGRERLSDMSPSNSEGLCECQSPFG